MTHTHTKRKFLAAVVLLGLNVHSFAQANKAKEPESPVFTSRDGRLHYTPDASGNRIPDFSYAGYMAGAEAIPGVAVKVVVPARSGDATLRIQSAIDYVSKLPLNKAGFRGAVLLEKGVYQVDGSLRIAASGVVLRGSGMGPGGTVLLGNGVSRETLVRLAGNNDKKKDPEIKVASVYVPVNSVTLRLENARGLKVGDHIEIRRPSTKAWIDTLGTDHFGGGITALGWKPGQRDILWDRTITAVNGPEITIDAPITTALDPAFGGAFVAKYNWPSRLHNIGLENLALESVFDKNNLKDEDHRWMAVTLENLADAWVRQVVFRHFAGSAVFVDETAKRVTVEDCKSLNPVSEIGGQRRYTFYTAGQQSLFQRIYSEFGYHDFAVGFCAAGPNAFVQCESHLPYNFSGTIDSWASGVLFDIVNVDGNAISFSNRGQDGQGAGWSAANSVLWQCTAAKVYNEAPPTAQNWAFGIWAQFQGNGYWDMSNEQIQPRSLYYAQLLERLGEKAKSRVQLLKIGTEASSSPPVSVAMALTAQSVKPAPVLTDLIDSAYLRNPVSITARGIKTIDKIGIRKAPAVPAAEEFHVQNGLLLRGDVLVTGRRTEVPWWNGSARRYGLANAKPHVTRFVPGKTGRGLTDELGPMTDSLKSANIVALDHNYGLWYERRRDDHERIRRMDGEVWPPFYELPFARSGQGTAWDGLSKYDLTRYNKWYWSRLKQYADLADQKGLVLIHENYFQHNIIEAGAHYADFPWRPVNNINNTGFPEPVPYAGDKRVFMAEQFYDISNPVRREIHKSYIKQCLNNFTGNSGVIQLIGAEFTGPLHFVQFWLDTIKEWEKETGKHAIIGLSTTRDVQDAILADKERASVVDVIDIKYWHYQADGNAYAPQGGQNLAPRQHARLLKPKASSFEQVYRAVSEYRQKYPEKAVTYAADGFDGNGWAVFMAGGSLASVPHAPAQFLKDAASMQPASSSAGMPKYTLGNGRKAYIVYNASAGPVKIELGSGSWEANWLDPRTGQIRCGSHKIKGGGSASVEAPSSNLILWLRKS